MTRLYRSRCFYAFPRLAHSNLARSLHFETNYRHPRRRRRLSFFGANRYLSGPCTIPSHPICVSGEGLPLGETSVVNLHLVSPGNDFRAIDVSLPLSVRFGFVGAERLLVLLLCCFLVFSVSFFYYSCGYRKVFTILPAFPICPGIIAYIRNLA